MAVVVSRSRWSVGFLPDDLSYVGNDDDDEYDEAAGDDGDDDCYGKSHGSQEMQGYGGKKITKGGKRRKISGQLSGVSMGNTCSRQSRK